MMRPESLSVAANPSVVLLSAAFRSMVTVISRARGVLGLFRTQPLMNQHLFRPLAVVVALCLYPFADVAAPTLTVKSAAGNLLTLRAQSAARGLVLESSTDLANWRSEQAGAVTNGAAEFRADTAGFGNIFFRVREATADETANPFTITPTPNTDFVRSVLITADGGSAKLTDDNGTVYQLTVPALALPGFEEVTMRVVNDAGTLPLGGGFAGGVILEPEGLWFYTPATLTITTTAALPGPKTVGFGWKTANGELHLVPTTVSSNQVTFSLAALGNFGVAGATTDGLTNLLAHPPVALADQFAQGLAINAQLPAGQGPQGIHRPKDLTDAQLAAFIARFRLNYNIEVIPALNEALANDTLLDSSLNTVQNWYVSLALVAIDDARLLSALSAESAEALARSHDLVIQALEHAYDKCQDHDLTQIARLISCGRWAQTPMLAGQFSDGERQLYRKFIQNCAQFEFQMHSDFLYTIKSLGKAHTIVTTLVEVKMQLDDQNQLTAIKGNGTIKVDTAELTSNEVPAPCVYAGVSPLGGVVVIDAVDLGLNQVSTNRSAPPKIKVLFNPFLPSPEDNYQVSCPVVGTLNYNLWPAFFGAAHSDEIVKIAPGQVLSLQDWVVHPGSEEIAAFESFGTVTTGAGIGEELTEFTLHHTPGH
jgi:hypothetical protein